MVKLSAWTQINPLKVMPNCNNIYNILHTMSPCLYIWDSLHVYRLADVFQSDGKRNICTSTQGWKISSSPKHCVWLCRNLLQHQEINLPKAWLLLLEDWATRCEHCLKTALGNKKQQPYKTLLLVIFRLLTSRRHPCQDGHLGGRVYKSCRL